jgi:hypothetical protein
VEETWLSPKGGEMVGTFRVVENDKTLVIELIALSETPTGIEFRLRHFTPTLAPWETAGATTLKLASLDPTRVVFENPGAGQPKRYTFTRISPDTYVSRSEIVPDGNNPQVTEITYHREKTAAASPAPKKGGGSANKKQ